MYKNFLKDLLDIVFSALLLLALLPLLAVIFLALMLELKSFPIFLQRRGLTISGKTFRLIKFKTMMHHSHLQKQGDGTHDVFLKPELENYIPPFAGWLRRTGMDELPQLINVLIGEMSIIGPRPLMISDLLLLENQNCELMQQREALTCKPGITGMWQLLGDRKLGLQNLIELDFIYERKISFSLDLLLSFITIPFLMLGLTSDAIQFRKQSSRKIDFSFLLLLKSGLLNKIKNIF